MNNEKHLALIFLGGVSLVASMLTLGKLILSKTILNYGSEQWVASLFFILVLLAIGFGFLYLSEHRPSLIGGAIFLGIFCFILSLYLYTHIGFAQITRRLPYREFMGLTTLFLLSFSIGPLLFSAICSDRHSCAYLRWPSYFYAAATLLLLFGVIDKYVFTGLHINEYTIIEAMILGVGASIFFYLHSKSKTEYTET